MDPGQTPPPRLRVILDHRTKNFDGPTSATVWNPGDELQGRLELSSTEDLHIGKIAIFFEGVSRNWIPESGVRLPRLMKAERMFLSQAHDMLPSNVSQRDPPLGTVILEAPFHFIISRAIPCTNPDSPEQCLHLPPSLLLGDKIFDEATGKLFAQPSITYYLRAIANFTINDTGAKGSQETFLPVTVAPYTEELPPTETDDFPMEFKERETKVLRRSLLGTPLGTMKVSLQEPSALAYDTRSTHSHTTALLRLEFESAGPSSNDVPKSLQGLSFTVLSLVRVKTFYSVKSFPRLPSQSLLDSSGDMKLRDGIIKLETQHVRDASWGYRFNPESQATATQASLASLSRSIEGVLDGGNTRKPMASEPGGKWISNWTISIEVNGRLLPTFCSSLVARFYTLIVRVKVAGARQEAFDFEVPLQVIHTPPVKTDSSESSRPPVEEIRERFLQYQRASDASWFSDYSLQSEQDPPQYYA